ncbi:MAG: hypothetical protein ACI8QG_002042, partial [Flavobacteriales bacterium]
MGSIKISQRYCPFLLGNNMKHYVFDYSNSSGCRSRFKNGLFLKYVQALNRN